MHAKCLTVTSESVRPPLIYSTLASPEQLEIFFSSATITAGLPRNDYTPT